MAVAGFELVWFSPQSSPLATAPSQVAILSYRKSRGYALLSVCSVYLSVICVRGTGVLVQPAVKQYTSSPRRILTSFFSFLYFTVSVLKCSVLGYVLVLCFCLFDDNSEIMRLYGARHIFLLSCDSSVSFGCITQFI